MVNYTNFSENNTALIRAFCRALMGAEKGVEWKGLTLGLFVSRTLNQHVLRTVGSKFCSLTTLCLEQVDRNVLTTLISRGINMFKQLIFVSFVFTGFFSREEGFLLAVILKGCGCMEEFRISLKGNVKQRLALLLAELRRKATLALCSVSSRLGYSAYVSGDWYQREGFQDFWSVAFEQLGTTLTIHKSRGRF